jgi:hypothetical protein
MERRKSAAVAKDFASVLKLDELLAPYPCPFCTSEVVAAEGRQGFYWKCPGLGCQYARNFEQDRPTITDGVLKCRRCQGDLAFEEYRGKPCWRCQVNRLHRQRVERLHLLLPNMARQVPTKWQQAISAHAKPMKKGGASSSQQQFWPTGNGASGVGATQPKPPPPSPPPPPPCPPPCSPPAPSPSPPAPHPTPPRAPHSTPPPPPPSPPPPQHPARPPGVASPAPPPQQRPWATDKPATAADSLGGTEPRSPESGGRIDRANFATPEPSRSNASPIGLARQDIVKKLGKERDPIGFAILRAKTSVDDRTLERALSELVKEGIVTQIGSGGTARYLLAKR